MIQALDDIRTHFPAPEAAICGDIECNMIFLLSERVCPSCGGSNIVPVTSLFAGNAKKAVCAGVTE